MRAAWLRSCREEGFERADAGRVEPARLLPQPRQGAAGAGAAQVAASLDEGGGDVDHARLDGAARLTGGRQPAGRLVVQRALGDAGGGTAAVAGVGGGRRDVEQE